jgi:hypothetical protein
VDVIICQSRNFVFVHIHKTAGESVTSALRPLLVDGDLEVRGRPEVRVNGMVLSKHSTALEARTALGAERWERYFSFSFVRHPIDRTLSLYRYIATWSDPPKPGLGQRLGLRSAPKRGDHSQWPEVRAYRATDSFSEFIRHPLLDHAPGMQPQVTSLCDADGELLVDFVGRFERIGQDLAHVGQVLGLPDVVLRSTNASRRPGDSEAELTPEDRAFLAARFEADVERFGYHP